MSTSQAALRVVRRRGDHDESEHLVDAVLCDADGRVVRSWGAPDRLVMARSAIKTIQARLAAEEGEGLGT